MLGFGHGSMVLNVGNGFFFYRMVLVASAL